MPDDSAVSAAIAYARANVDRFVRELCDFVHIPSVSGAPQHPPHVRQAATWLARALHDVGFLNSHLLTTDGAPLVVASTSGSTPHLVVYGHYDVQPPGQREAWHTPPFTPVVKHGAIFGRGASDDKGQLFAHVKALESWMRTRGELPTPILCLFEGEEEIGSPSLREWLAAYGHALRAETAIISDTRMRAADQPAITHALRGKMRIELVVIRRGGDVHAGDFAGVVLDPARELARIVASLHDARNRISVPGFHDHVRLLSSAERAYMRKVGPRDSELIAAAQSEPLEHDPRRSLYELTTAEPSLSVTEFTAGDFRERKSAIPTSARALLDIRLVPDQQPAMIAHCLERHVKRVAPRGAHVALRVLTASRALSIAPRHPALQAGARAAARTFGRASVFLRSGGTIPIATDFQSHGITPVLMGFALSDDGMHAPNEHFSIDRFLRAIECSIRFFAEAGHSTPPIHARPTRPVRVDMQTGIHV